MTTSESSISNSNSSSTTNSPPSPILHWQYCKALVQRTEQYQRSPLLQPEIINYTTSLRCQMDLCVSIISLCAVLVLLAGLVQEILRHCYHRDKLKMMRKVSLRGNKERISEMDPYRLPILQE